MAIMRQMHADRRENELFRHGDRSREQREDRDKQEHDRDDDDYELDGGMHGLSTKVKIVRGTDDYIAKQDGEGIYSQESIFIGKGKDKYLRNSIEFEKFFKGLLMYNSEMISVKELENLVRSILSEFPDLRYRIDEFLARCEKKMNFLLMSSVKFIDVGTMISPTIYARRSLCYLMCDQPDAALRDTMQAQCVYRDWPTAFYMQSVALAKLVMQKDATDMLNEAAALEEKRQKGEKG
ncbi:hypothetical protein Droror1_Dr00012171 [Drosera rotundifolia]